MILELLAAAAIAAHPPIPNITRTPSPRPTRTATPTRTVTSTRSPVPGGPTKTFERRNQFVYSDLRAKAKMLIEPRIVPGMRKGRRTIKLIGKSPQTGKQVVYERPSL